MTKYLISTSLRDLIAQQFDERYLESEYRRGYVDCLISLHADLAQAPKLIRRATLRDRLLSHWAKLLDWQISESGEPKQPPAFEWKKGANLD